MESKINMLERMIHHTFMYKSKNIKIKDYYLKEDQQSVKIITDGDNLDINLKQIEQFKNDCLPVEDDQQLQQRLTVVKESNDDINNLKNILMDNIQKVQKDKEYIGQAKVINNSVNTLLNMVNTQIKIERLKK